MENIEKFKFDTLKDNYDFVVFARDLSNDFQFIDGNTEKLFGVSQEDFLSGKVKWLDVIHPEDKKKMTQELFDALRNKADRNSVDFRVVMPDNSIKWCRRVGKVVKQDDQWLMTGIVLDINQEKISKSDSDTYSLMFTSITDNIEHGLMILNKDYDIIYSNNYAVSLFNYDIEDYVTKSFDEFFRISDGTPISSLIEATITKGFILKYNLLTEKKAYAVTTKGTIPIELKVSAGEDKLFYLFFSEVTELFNYAEELNSKSMELEDLNRELNNRVKEEIKKNMMHEKMISEQRKIADMGRLVSSIAHRWRQPLNSIGLNVQYIKELYDLEELTKEELYPIHDFCMDQIQRMSRTIDGFANLFKNNAEKKEVNLINKTIDIVTLYSPSIEASGILLTVEAELDDVPYKDINSLVKDKYIVNRFNVFCIENEIFQAMLNILSNAIDAINTRKEILNYSGHINILLRHKDKKIVIEISDNGTGIDENVIGNVFEPYFTTKDEGKGIGMGLYLAKLYVEKGFKGRIACSNLENGCRFTITLPLGS